VANRRRAKPAGVAAPGADLGVVEDQSFVIRDFQLASGAVMPEVRIAYETYGRLARDGRNNAVLITHGYTRSHHAAERTPANGSQPGWWDGLIGPGNATDTDRLFVVSSNMLGSSYGSTNGASRNPANGDPYGPDFPAITCATSSRRSGRSSSRSASALSSPSPAPLMAAIRRWAVEVPDMMDGIVAVVTAPRASDATARLDELTARLAAEPAAAGPRTND
jgi:homoserine O-acetyltransferase/O-succinyltransferase